MELTKDILFSWKAQQQEALDNLKIGFTSAPVLQPFDCSRETIMEIDALNPVIASALSQYSVKNSVKTLHPIDHYTKTLSMAEHNWPMHDKELWAIVSCF